MFSIVAISISPIFSTFAIAMEFYNRNKAIERMNEWGRLHKRFLFIINYKQDQSYIEEIDSIDSQHLLYNFNGITNESNLHEDKEAILSKIRWAPSPMDFLHYKESFNTVKRNILSGNSFLTNLTCATPIETNLSLKDIYCISQAKYKLWLKETFVVFSPEIFLKIKGKCISSYPMKGTIDANQPNAEDILMDDPKEAAEHATITDLIRNDLSMVADHVSVKRYRYIDKIETSHGPILQTSSEICGLLPDDFYNHLGDIFFRLLPAGSITGAPKRKTMEIISEAENYQRNFYTGVTGYFDGYNLDSAVMIRFLEQSGNHLIYKSGGGITCQSDALNEYNEMKQKIYVPIY
jgi:para-aminobenzoate synthetase component 1